MPILGAVFCPHSEQLYHDSARMLQVIFYQNTTALGKPSYFEKRLLWAVKRLVDDFAYLPSAGRSAWAECAVGVAGDDAVGVGCFDVAIEGIGRGHVAE